MSNGWTGGQYSTYRALLGLYLFVHFVHLVPWGPELFSSEGVLPDASASPVIRLFPNILALTDGPAVVVILLALGATGAVLLGMGYRDRWAAGAIWYIWACLYGRNPLISNPGLPYVGWLLLAHVVIPPAPYGSLAARGRADPGGDWRLPQGVHAIAWFLMSVGYSYSGFAKLTSPSWIDGKALRRVLDNPLARPGYLHDLVLAAPDVLLEAGTWGTLAFELSFAFLALVRPVRPLIWTAMLSMHLSLMALIDFADLSLGMVMLHLFTFDPAWIPATKKTEKDVVFYDGHCGLCDRVVRFILAEDREGSRFQLAHLQGTTFQEAVPAERRRGLPDSIVILRSDGALLVRSEAVLHVLSSLGGSWRILGVALGCVPRWLRDRAYDAVARVRGRLFGLPVDACPALPPLLRSRFRG